MSNIKQINQAILATFNEAVKQELAFEKKVADAVEKHLVTKATTFEAFRVALFDLVSNDLQGELYTLQESFFKLPEATQKGILNRSSKFGTLRQVVSTRPAKDNKGVDIELLEWKSLSKKKELALAVIAFAQNIQTNDIGAMASEELAKQALPHLPKAKQAETEDAIRNLLSGNTEQEEEKPKATKTDAEKRLSKQQSAEKHFLDLKESGVISTELYTAICTNMEQVAIALKESAVKNHGGEKFDTKNDTTDLSITTGNTNTKAA